ncbi:hypothetical protein BpHYR1_049162 [Brachionus plicatilis]|uniref:Uncharacterized protein n=1 Tax=Brachionus plicatilis TaxID=10195 RepID=A0A3M7QW43_BRAPC|nr:hypothetical protein BpHYR1_049162 [Brachionus plicatilis]
MNRVFGAWSNIDLTIPMGHIMRQPFFLPSGFLTEPFLFLKPRVYVRPCTKYPIHGIKACVAKQGDTFQFKEFNKIIYIPFLFTKFSVQQTNN